MQKVLGMVSNTLNMFSVYQLLVPFQNKDNKNILLQSRYSIIDSQGAVLDPEWIPLPEWLKQMEGKSSVLPTSPTSPKSTILM